MENDKEKSGMEKILGCIWTWVGIVVLVIFVWRFYPTLVCWKLGVSSEAGTGGYDALDTLFSGLAFAGVIMALYLQREDLKQQREEMKAATKEQERQREVYELQRFESKFQSLVGLMYEARKEISYDERNGLSAIKYLCESLENSLLLFKENKGYTNISDFFLTDSDLREFKKNVDTKISDIQEVCKGWASSWVMCLISIENDSLTHENKEMYRSYLGHILHESEIKVLKLLLKKVNSEFFKKGMKVCVDNNVLHFEEEGGNWWDVYRSLEREVEEWRRTVNAFPSTQEGEQDG